MLPLLTIIIIPKWAAAASKMSNKNRPTKYLTNQQLFSIKIKTTPNKNLFNIENKVGMIRFRKSIF